MSSIPSNQPFTDQPKEDKLLSGVITDKSTLTPDQQQVGQKYTSTPDFLPSARGVDPPISSPTTGLSGESEILPEAKTFSRTKQILIVLTITFQSLLNATAGQIMNIALPTIQTELNMKETDLQWVISAYNLSIGCLLLFCGKIADIYGRKNILMVGMGIFGFFHLIGGFMQNGAGLICCRAFSGVGIAMVTPSSTGIIAECFTGKARSRAFTCFTAGFSIGGVLGMVISGLFVAYVKYTWRASLFFIAGLNLLGLIMVIFIIPFDGSHTDDKRLDWVGATLITAGLVMFLFAISDAQSAPQGWKTSYIIALLVIGITMTTMFFFWEHYIANKTDKPPLMRLELWTRANGRLAALYFTSFLGNMGFMNALYNATLFFQEVQSTGPVGAMLRFLPVEISGIFCTILVAMLIHKVPAYWLLVLGLLACGLGNMCFAISEEDTNYWRLPFNGMWLIVAGVDLFMPTGLIFVAKFALPDEYSVANGLFSTMLRLGISIGLSLNTIISNSIKNESLDDGLSEKHSYLKGLQSGSWLTASPCWFGILIAAIALRGLGTVGKDDKNDKKGKDEESKVAIQEKENERVNDQEDRRVGESGEDEVV